MPSITVGIWNTFQIPSSFSRANGLHAAPWPHLTVCLPSNHRLPCSPNRMAFLNTDNMYTNTASFYKNVALFFYAHVFTHVTVRSRAPSVLHYLADLLTFRWPGFSRGIQRIQPSASKTNSDTGDWRLNASDWTRRPYIHYRLYPTRHISSPRPCALAPCPETIAGLLGPLE